MIDLRHADCLDILPTMEAASVHAIVTDPPYGLSFMGKGWDRGVPGVEFWTAMLRVLRPGGYLLAFGGTRTYHRMVCAIEDAGFEVRDMVSWIYGSGFPKGTDKAKIPEAWQGFNTALKPALEPICLARKPMAGSLATNLQLWGCGAMNIDGCRIEHETINGGNLADNPHLRGTKLRAAPVATSFGRAGDETPLTSQDGRWPANVIHDGGDEVLAAFPEAPGQQGDLTGNEPSRPALNTYGDFPAPRIATARGDAGSAARFFYCAKADREDRDHGVDGEKRPLLWSSGEKNPGSFQSPNTDRSARNHHPTVKPTELMRWLVRLVTPPGGTVLDPFMGSGSTGRAAVLEGFDFIGIEREAEYIPIARSRIGVVDPDSFTLRSA